MADVAEFFEGLFDVVSSILLPSSGIGPLQVIIWAALVLGFIPMVVQFVKSWR